MQLPPSNSPVVLATPSPVTHRTAEENLGLGYIAAILRQGGYKVIIIDAWLEGLSTQTLVDRILAVGPALWIGFSCYRTSMGPAIEAMRALRANAVLSPIIVGGYGPTFEPDLFLDAGFSVVAIGEFETTSILFTRAVADRSSLRKVPNLVFREDGQTVRTPPPSSPVSLDQIPLPARDTLQFVTSRKSAPHIETSRGCLASCAFCSIVAFGRQSAIPKWRERSIPQIVSELKLLQDLGATVVKVIDDSFIEPPRDAAWAARLADALCSEGVALSLRGSIRADRVTDQLLQQLKRAGFYSFACGIENYSGAALKRMGKSASVDQNFSALDLLHKNGFIVQAGHILFDHATTVPELRENIDAMKRYSWTVSKGIFSEMFAAEGTAFTRFLRSRKKVLPSEPATMNLKYAVEDRAAYLAYIGLKRWHQSHAQLHDRAVDVLNAPKAISARGRTEFLSLAQKMKACDLNFFELLLDFVGGHPSTDQLTQWVDGRISEADASFQLVATTLDAAYSRYGLVYDAAPNPFLA
jgi:hypothetical protein